MALNSANLQSNYGSSVWLPGIVVCIARFLPANVITCVLRLVDKGTSQQFEDFKTVQLSLPSPAHIFLQRWGSPDAFRGLTREQRLKLLCLTAASGSITNLEVALDNIGLYVKDVLEAAAEAGQLDMCKMLRERGYFWGDSLIQAAKGGQRHVCEWMLASGCPLTSHAVYAAALYGHEELVHWLLRLLREGRAADAFDVVGLLHNAAKGGLNLAAFQRVLQQVVQQLQPEEMLLDYEKAKILAAAASSSMPDWQAKMEWLEGLGYPRTGEACSTAAACSPDEEAVSRLQWLHSRGYIPDAAAGEAAKCGNLAALRFLMEQVGVHPPQRGRISISRYGQIAVLKYLHAKAYCLDPKEVAWGAAAAGMTKLPVLAWAVEVLGVTPDNVGNLTSWAARSGSIEVLSWLHDRGWTWSCHTISNAAESGCEEAVEWLVEQGCLLPVDGEAYTRAASNGDLAMIRCLHRLGCPWGSRGRLFLDYMEGIYFESPVPVLRCLVELGYPVDWDAAVKVAETRGHGEYRTAVLAWLGEERQRLSLGAQQ